MLLRPYCSLAFALDNSPCQQIHDVFDFDKKVTIFSRPDKSQYV